MKKNNATTDLSSPYRTPGGFIVKAPKGIDKEHSRKCSVITSNADLRTKGGKRK